jgi:hypothetical protein
MHLYLYVHDSKACIYEYQECGFLSSCMFWILYLLSTFCRHSCLYVQDSKAGIYVDGKCGCLEVGSCMFGFSTYVYGFEGVSMYWYAYLYVLIYASIWVSMYKLQNASWILCFEDLEFGTQQISMHNIVWCLWGNEHPKDVDIYWYLCICVFYPCL